MPDAVLPLDYLAPAPDNPRQIAPAALAGLGVSMHDFGDLSGVVFDDEAHELVAGHQRVKALAAAGATTWTRTSDEGGHVVDPRTGERFDVRLVRWSDQKRRAARIVANSAAISGEWTESALDQIETLRELPNFEALRLDELTQDIHEELLDRAREEDAAANVAEDEPPPVPANPVSRTGDLWLLGTYVECPKCGKHMDV